MPFYFGIHNTPCDFTINFDKSEKYSVTTGLHDCLPNIIFLPGCFFGIHVFSLEIKAYATDILGKIL